MLVTPVVAGFVTTLRQAAVPRQPPNSDVRSPGLGRGQGSYDNLVASPQRLWAMYAGQRSGIPVRALESYAGAEEKVAGEAPDCRLHWSTLAGIGWVESHHGHYGGRVLEVDGRPSAPIFGVALNGEPMIRAIRDTDDGRLDNDRTWDRAVGPMQFIPGTWAMWSADGDGDGREDPQDLDDAALAAGRYLCRNGGDLGTAAGWRRAILTYNHSRDYLQAVRDRAFRYATVAE
jgi:membrane-bound lytic murein transglycosylase B